MTASFGIDHPLLATHDIDAFRTRLIAMGFNMTPVGKHPWGTSTSLAMFEGCLLEIMGIYDATLVDEVPAGDFRFGRHILEHLQQREGVALTALHSTNSQADAKNAQEAGFVVAGHLEFGRDVTLPDGKPGRTKTTLALLPDPEFPRLSFFLCQQHRPELIYVPEWLEHPNRVNGICGVTVVARQKDQPRLKNRYAALYGACVDLFGGFQVQTANGVMRFLERSAFEDQIGPLPPELDYDATPFIAGMDFTALDLDVLRTHLERSGTAFREISDGLVLKDGPSTANTIFRFFQT